MNKLLAAGALLLIVLAGCTPQKKIVYFQDRGGPDTLYGGEAHELRIYPEDILQVQLFTVNPDAMPGLSASFERQPVDNRSAYEKGFVVDKDGNIDIPLIGTVPVGGKTIYEAKQEILKRFREFIDDPVVTLKKLSFKVTILGEVTKPGLYYIPNEKMTLTEALGMAGDLTRYGDRTDIRIYRKDEQGRTRELKLDLTGRDVFSPEFHYVRQDDLIYIKPIKRKALADINPALVVFTSIISTTVIVVTLIIQLNKN
jgi:polysaccharide export outer membrane protein